MAKTLPSLGWSGLVGVFEMWPLKGDVLLWDCWVVEAFFLAYKKPCAQHCGVFTHLRAENTLALLLSARHLLCLSPPVIWPASSTQLAAADGTLWCCLLCHRRPPRLHPRTRHRHRRRLVMRWWLSSCSPTILLSLGHRGFTRAACTRCSV
jgi:hypothetical protein